MRRHWRYLFLLAAALWLSACATHPPAPPEPASPCADTGTASFVVCQFYGRYITLKPFGLPGNTTLRLLRPFLSDSLGNQLQEAIADQTDYMEDFPQQLPPLASRPLFSSAPRFPDHFDILEERSFASDSGHHWALVRVSLRSDSAETVWQDEIVLRQTPLGYRIEDFLFPRDKAPPRRLTNILRQAFE